jgi:hypothetical protein
LPSEIFNVSVIKPELFQPHVLSDVRILFVITEWPILRAANGAESGFKSAACFADHGLVFASGRVDHVVALNDVPGCSSRCVRKVDNRKWVGVMSTAGKFSEFDMAL